MDITPPQTFPNTLQGGTGLYRGNTNSKMPILPALYDCTDVRLHFMTMLVLCRARKTHRVEELLVWIVGGSLCLETPFD
jgi:hypothetical protein